MDVHRAKVAKIAASVRSFYERREPYRIYHGSTNSTRKADRKRSQLVDTSGLTTILTINTANKTALVEPNVPMDALVAATLPLGFIPPVVMEFPGITVGGGFAGTAGESSSFRWGLFDRTINRIEMVLADGEVVRASPTERPDLFRGAASSFGTLGVTTMLEVQLIDAKPLVELTYIPVNGIEEAVAKIEAETVDASVDYLDGIMYSHDSGLVISGRMVDTPSPGVRVQEFLKSTDPWFYLHAQKMLKASPTKSFTEATPLADYLFRYDRGGFWVGKYAYSYFLTPFNRITRWALDRFMHARVMYHALHKSGHVDFYVIQDVAVPYAGAAEFNDYLDKDFGHYPLWICPLKQTGKAHSSNDPDGESAHSLMANKTIPNAPDMLLNFGVWGPGSKDLDEFEAMNRRLEHKVHDLGGRKWLYAQAFHTEEEFWTIYDRKQYDALREKYHATHLPTVFDKVRVDFTARKAAVRSSWRAWAREKFWGIYPLSGVYGVISAFLGRDYLLPRTSLLQSLVSGVSKTKQE